MALALSRELSVGCVTTACIRTSSYIYTSDTDTVTLAPTLVIENQSIGVASQAQGFDGVDGILGVGPTDLTQGTVSGTNQIPTVVDNLFSQSTITSDSLGIFFQPTTQEGAINGELTFGGVDSTKYVTRLKPGAL